MRPAAGLLVSLCVIAGCTSRPAPANPAPVNSVAERPAAGSAARGPASVSAAGASRPGASASARVTPAPVTSPAVTVSRLRTPDGSLVTVAVFRGPVRYVLHDGSQDPASAYTRVVRAGPAVAAAERGRLLAAFNGGFLMRSHAGGYVQEGHVFRALRHGLASLVIDRSGRARIGAWQHGLPAPGEAVYSVRQNLWPLVDGGRPTAQAARWWRWGGTFDHAEYVARSALGQDAAGNLIYAASMSTTPADLALALVRSGARTGMELDINPEWVQLAVASTPGGPLAQGIPGQVRPATQYLTGWSRDFVTVLTP